MKYKNKEEILKALGNFKSVDNIQSNKGNDIANQFILYFEHGTLFQSYRSIIAIELEYNSQEEGVKYYLGDDWAYSTTTSKYRTLFLNRDTKQVRKDIKEGVAVLVRGL